MPAESFDVLIVGAGVSGVAAACHLSRDCPAKTYAVLERRSRVGGTWDLFTYPGVRSDSDMNTFGYAFAPWLDIAVLADGPAIRRYVEDTARKHGVIEHIRFGTRVRTLSWSSADGRWTVDALDEATGEPRQFSATVLITATGYYDADQGYRPQFPGEDNFAGVVVHPQHWPADLDYVGKKVVVIGSGATAVTLVPALLSPGLLATDTPVGAAHVTMLQRSLSYVLSVPATDAISAALAKVLPPSAVYRIARMRNILLQRGMYVLARRAPALVRRLIRRSAERRLAGSCDIAHFTPSYQPWDQRVCVVPDGDLFRALRTGRADVVTGRIETFTSTGIRLASGADLDADIVVTATGLEVQMLGGADLIVDGEPVTLRERVTYKGVLVEGVPNCAVIFGYTNASWTLKADLACEYVCRLLNHMDAHEQTQFVVHAADADRAAESVLSSLAAGYVRRGDARLPRQGTRGPWKVRNNVLRDAPMLRRAPIDDGILQLHAGPVRHPAVSA